MTNHDELRALATAAKDRPGAVVPFSYGQYRPSNEQFAFMAACSPETVLELLDALEQTNSTLETVATQLAESRLETGAARASHLESQSRAEGLAQDVMRLERELAAARPKPEPATRWFLTSCSKHGRAHWSDYSGCTACLSEDRVPAPNDARLSLVLAPDLAARIQEMFEQNLGQLNTPAVRAAVVQHLNFLVRSWMGVDRHAFVLDESPEPQDPLHPWGKCTCAGEGRCAWCLLDCNAQQDEKECGECRECLGAKLRHAEAVASAAMERTGAAEADCARWAARVKELERRLNAVRRASEGDR